ncbi:MAG TPA: iron ABC transporter permease [Verrucomicrobiae bacterium]|jgi:iron(III) transport system permease protein|nr:iron ABC transporter permease [Verrucomicrobiae bacterium]
MVTEAARPERHLDRSAIVWALFVIVLLVLVVNPLARLLWTSFQHPDTGGFTLENYAAAYGRWRYVEALLNSLVVGFAAALLCVVFGVPMAWAVSRTDMPAKGLVWAAVLGTFIMPNYLGAVAWILLAGPNAGWLNRAFTALTGATAGPFNVYSMPGLVLVIACYSFPYMFVFTRGALDLVSSEMEDAASTLGAGIARTTLRITLPLVLPAILGAFIVVFLEAIALFGTPALIALPARFQVMTTTLWQMFEFPPRLQVAAAYSMPLLLITVFLFWLQYRIIARKGYVALTGKGGERRPVQLGIWRWVALGYCLFVTSLSFFLPLLVVLQAAFAKAWGRGFALDNVTLRNVRFVLFDQPSTRRATLNTFLYAGAASLIALALALAIAYIVARRLVPMGRVLTYVAMAPFVIPGIVLAIGFYAAYTTRPLVLYGTAWILILAFATRFLPIAYTNSDAAIRAINPELEDAARILGGSRLLSLRKVVGPLLKRGLAGAFILVFIPATRELSSAIFLYTTGTQVLSVLLFDKSDEGNFELLSAMGLILVVVTVALILVGFRLVGRDFLLRRTAT